MILIAHKGNIYGADNKENHPSYVNNALDDGFECEVDIRYIDGNYYQGHDYPTYKVTVKELLYPKLWCHAKDGTTLRQALKDKLHVFYDSNSNNNYTLTSKGYIWHWDGKSMIYVMDKDGLIGICSDYVGYLK